MIFSLFIKTADNSLTKDEIQEFLCFILLNLIIIFYLIIDDYYLSGKPI